LSLAGVWTAAHPRRGRPKPMKDDGLILKTSKRIALKPVPVEPGSAISR